MPIETEASPFASPETISAFFPCPAGFVTTPIKKKKAIFRKRQACVRTSGFGWPTQEYRERRRLVVVPVSPVRG